MHELGLVGLVDAVSEVEAAWGVVTCRLVEGRVVRAVVDGAVSETKSVLVTVVRVAVVIGKLGRHGSVRRTTGKSCYVAIEELKGGSSDFQDGDVQRVLEDQSSEAFIQTSHALLGENAGVAVKESFITGHDRHHLRACIRVVNDGPRALWCAGGGVEMVAWEL